MTNPTQQDLDALAEFAGGVKKLACPGPCTTPVPAHWFEDTQDMIYDWDPYNKPAHWWLVLKAIVQHEIKRLVTKDSGWGEDLVWERVLMSLSNRAGASWSKPFDLAAAVCEAALRIIAKGE